ncbi:alpha-N-arabinofuranosidase [Herbiconiux liangxiaofengii]|uniref:alpha-N-arabinofuranosidase n=1 Tax=Herbiconiux liangxiaofengii TaxID=3342795 RepID=UPI0035B6E55F
MTVAARAVIDLDLPGPTISRHLYGHFAEHLGRCIYGGFWVGEASGLPNDRGIRLDVVEALRELRIPNLRWPGGCFADEYHWRDGIGPREHRPRMVNSNWGDVVEDNSFGTHEFLHLCDLLGADPYVNGNVGSGSVREMSEWVEYLTRDGDSPMAALRRANGRDEPWRVPFWGIGNEAWGCGGHLTAEGYTELARQYATFLRDQGGNSLQRIAAGAGDEDYRWTETLMKAVSRLGGGPDLPEAVFQAISLHYYTVPGPWHDKGDATRFDADDWYATMVKARHVDTVIRNHSAVMDAYDPARTIGLVLDEWGTWWNVEPGTNPGFLHQQNTLRDALVASVHFDVFHTHAARLRMANIAQTVNVLQAMVLTDPESPALVLTPSYHVFRMNVGHHDASALAVHLTAPDAVREVGGGRLETVSASASLHPSGRSALVSLTNLDLDEPLEVTLDLRGASVRGATARILTAAEATAHNTAENPDAVVVRDHAVTTAPAGSPVAGHGLVVRVPPHSYVTVQVELETAATGG